MGRATAYYRKERLRHAEAGRVRLTFREVRRILRLLAYEHEVPLRHVRRVRGRRSCTFNPRTWTITINEDWSNLRTAIHEFAHALDWKLRGGRLRGRRWHTKFHADLVDDLLRALRARGWYVQVPPPAPWMRRRRPGAPLVPRRAA